MTDTTTTTEPFLQPHFGLEEELRAIVEPVVAREQLELVQLQLVRGQHRDLLRLSVDRPGAGVTPGKGVSMAELERVNRLLGDLLDVEDNARKLFKERWELEVGSPGVDRPLTKKSHFKDVVGQKIKARLRLQKKSLLGRLDAVDDGGVIVDGERVAFADLDHAHVIFEFEKKAKPGHGKVGAAATPAGEPRAPKQPKQPKKGPRSPTSPSDRA
ncbi:MAG: ribosome maturation factor RimP [Deltaproteobacteria bacterium]|nr:ribosome maturation factor RimP [Deltaproteobacteria bacterium]